MGKGCKELFPLHKTPVYDSERSWTLTAIRAGNRGQLALLADEVCSNVTIVSLPACQPREELTSFKITIDAAWAGHLLSIRNILLACYVRHNSVPDVASLKCPST